MKHIFIHIPKTAGTSFREVIKKNLSKEEAYEANEPKLDVNKVTDKTKIIYGHFPFGFHLKLEGEYKYLTLLREPVDRVLSWYYYIKQRGIEDPLYNLVKEQTIEEFAKMTSNQQTGMLAGMNYPCISDSSLDVALNNIEKHFCVVGASEKYSDFLNSVGDLLEFENLPTTIENSNKKRLFKQDLLQEQIEVIEYYNKLDIVLYNKFN